VLLISDGPPAPSARPESKGCARLRASGSQRAGERREELLVIVREGEGAVGLKDALTADERARGGISFRYAKLYAGERSLLDSDPDLALLPARVERSTQFGAEPGLGEPRRIHGA
jgi:hypothetical protein